MPKSQTPINSQNPKSEKWSLGIEHWSFQLKEAGFDPVPRDDRLFDVFPGLTRHRGFELWEKWTEKEVELIALRFQDKKPNPQRMKFSRQEIEEKLIQN